MRAIVITQAGGPEVLQLQDLPEPIAGAEECLIDVEAFGINRPDVAQRKGLYPPPPDASPLPGLELAGRIVSGDAAALAAAGMQAGDAVCALAPGGAYAERCVVPIAHCLPVPKGISMVEAASLPETLFTVWANVFGRAGLRVGEHLLVHGGSSGIGVAAIQLAKAFGAKVLVTVGSAQKAQACLELGADLAINYREQDFVSEVLAFTQGRGVDVVLDMIAGDYIGRELKCLADDGRIALISLQGGARAEIDAGQILRRRLTISGSTLRPRSRAFKAEVAAQLRERVWPLLASGQVRPVVYREMAADQIAQAHALMESSQHVGKIVMVW